ncbi:MULTISPECIES: YihY/virulence factor BrkB family protein [unclassified Microbacterium]|uniref:YihY/virulence factor BrkB family protein n=1 Tax=unclassified Microbacterium TaxID=2609290 RepID=UPI003866D054
MSSRDTDTDASLRDRWDASVLRGRLEEPIERATALTQKTLAWFPIRVWRHFLQRNGFLLAASISYQSLFALFATLYAAFAVAGVWVGGSERAITALIRVVNSYIPEFISASGPVHPDDVATVARQSGSLLAVTGAVALAIAIWTAIGFVTFTRRAVRDIFGLPFDMRSFVMLKLKDFAAALLFGIALVLGAAFGLIAGGIVAELFTVLNLPYASTSVDVLSRIASVLVGFALNSAALGSLIRFLTGTSLPWRSILPASLFGGAALSLLQLGAGFLAAYSPTNPLLATFSILVGMLLWLRVAGIVILVSASWVAVAAGDADVPLVAPSDEDHRSRVERARRLVADAEVRDAEVGLEEAHGWQRPAAALRLRSARRMQRRVDARRR